MGCDIHMHQELYVDGGWHHWAERDVWRNYHLFGLMADVRGGGPAIVEPRAAYEALMEPCDG